MEQSRRVAGSGGVERTDSDPPPSEVSSTSKPEPRLARTFESFRDRTYRWFFGSLFTAWAAMNIQQFIAGYMVFELTGSYAYLGAISVAQGIPMLLIAPIGGVLADQIAQKKYVVQAGQAANAVISGTIALTILTDAISVEHLLIAGLLQGTINSLQMPARQSLTPDVVGMDRLTNALALNTAGMNFNRLVMPGLAGWVLATINPEDGIAGTEYIYAAVAVLYLGGVLFMFRVPSLPAKDRSDRNVLDALTDLRAGFSYVRRTPELRMLLTVNLAIVMTSMPYFYLLPGFVEEVLGGSKRALGLLISIQGVGSLTGSLFIASMANRGRGRILLWSSLLLGVALTAFAISTTIWISALILVVVGLGQAGRMSLSNVLVQSYSSDEFRGRVMSLYMMEFGLTLIGTFVVGLVAAVAGPQLAIGITSVTLVVMVVGLLLKSPLVDLD